MPNSAANLRCSSGSLGRSSLPAAVKTAAKTTATSVMPPAAAAVARLRVLPLTNVQAVPVQRVSLRQPAVGSRTAGHSGGGGGGLQNAMARLLGPSTL